MEAKRSTIDMRRRCYMSKYLFQGSYTVEGLRGLLREGGTKGREAVEQLVKTLGGTLEAFDYAYGGDDFSSLLTCLIV
jgi:GYD domain